MVIIKATDFAKIQQNELTLDELKKQEAQEKQYFQAQFRIKEKLVEADKAVANSLQEERQLLLEKLALAQESFTAADQEIQRLRQALAGDKEVQKLTETITAQEQLIARQEQDMAALKTKIQLQAETIKAQETESQQIKADLAQAQSQQQKILQDNADLSQNIAGLNTKNQRQEETIKTQISEMQQVKFQLGQLQGQLQKAMQENTVLKQTSDRTAIRDAELEKQVTVIRETNSLAAKENLNLRTNLQKIDRQTSDLNNAISKLQQEKAALVDDKERAVQEMNRVIGSFSAEQEKNIQLEYKFKRAEQEFREMQSELKIAKETIAALEKQCCIPQKFLNV